MSLRTALVSAVLIISLPLPTHSHDIYSHLRDEKGESCCDDQDCRPALYRLTARVVQMYVDQQWINVPNAFNIALCRVIAAKQEEALGAVQPMNRTSAIPKACT
jgi:hypothetical protein